MQSGRLKNHMITASSIWAVNHAAHLARLHNRRRGNIMGSWSSKYNNRYQWLQVYFGGAAKIIRISTQGRHDLNQWVTQYYITHSLDRVHFSEYKERNSRKVMRDFVIFDFDAFLIWPRPLFCVPSTFLVTERTENLAFIELETKRSINRFASSFSINLGRRNYSHVANKCSMCAWAPR